MVQQNQQQLGQSEGSSPASGGLATSVIRISPNPQQTASHIAWKVESPSPPPAPPHSSHGYILQQALTNHDVSLVFTLKFYLLPMVIKIATMVIFEI